MWSDWTYWVVLLCSGLERVVVFRLEQVAELAMPVSGNVEMPICVQEIKNAKEAASLAVANEAERIADDLGAELEKVVRLEWFKSNNVSLRCMRVTSREVRVCLLEHCLQLSG
jgi:hypothetical protein